MGQEVERVGVGDEESCVVFGIDIGGCTVVACGFESLYQANSAFVVDNMMTTLVFQSLGWVSYHKKKDQRDITHQINHHHWQLRL